MDKQVRCGVLAALIACSLHVSAAPTWKKGLAIPVVIEGSVCSSATDKIAVTSTNQVLSCQSGLWAKAQGGAGTGLRGVYAPLAGKSISCASTGGEIRAWAYVDAAGNAYIRVWARSANNVSMACDTGYIAGAATYCVGGWPQAGGSATAPVYSGLSASWSGDGSFANCSAAWPAT